ncbi:MAG: MarR family transcriptional regulator [Candidatus Sericytochromatia bacterium]|nr:MarR family transcriptional regulator [Candidatus Sericytochromatia bacterium]
MAAPTPDDVSLLPVFRALMTCHAQVSRVAGRQIESMGLTPSQFDVIVTLGDTPGMTCSELGRRTLISKGTLTPVLDRLEARGLVVRRRGEADGRQVHVTLTPAGTAEYQRVFLPHVAYVRGYLDRLTPARQATLVEALGELQRVFEDA